MRRLLLSAGLATAMLLAAPLAAHAQTADTATGGTPQTSQNVIRGGREGDRDRHRRPRDGRVRPPP